MSKWYCGVTSQCLVTPAVTYSFTETHTTAGLIKCEWYLFCKDKYQQPLHLQPFLPTIHKAKYIGSHANRIQELSEEFGCVCTDSNRPKLFIGDEVLYVEMQTYNRIPDESLWLHLLAESIPQRRACIQAFIESLPEQLGSVVIEDNSIKNLLLDGNNQLVMIDPVFAYW